MVAELPTLSVEEFMSNTNKTHIVCDVDEILVDISPKWTYLIYQNKEYFGEYMNLDPNFDLDKHYLNILYRPTFYLNHWLMKPEHQVDTPEMQDVLTKMLDLYDNDTFYDNLKATKLGSSIALAAKSKLISKISVISRVTGNNKESKVRFIQNLFRGSMHKVEIYLVSETEKKSDVFSSLGNDIASLYEDELNNIKDILSNSDNARDLQIFMPSFQYNALDQEVIDLAKNKGCSMHRFDYEMS